MSKQWLFLWVVNSWGLSLARTKWLSHLIKWWYPILLVASVSPLYLALFSYFSVFFFFFIISLSSVSFPSFHTSNPLFYLDYINLEILWMSKWVTIPSPWINISSIDKIKHFQTCQVKPLFCLLFNYINYYILNKVVADGIKIYLNFLFM